MSDLLSELLLLERMPLAFHALVVEYTTRCTARCGMCYQSAGPKGSDVLGAQALTLDVIERCVDEARGLESVSLASTSLAAKPFSTKRCCCA